MLPSEALHRHREEIREIMRRYERLGITNLRVFGSATRREDTPESDIDFLVDAGRISLFTLGGLQADLEDLLETRVDLVASDGLKPDVRERIIREAVEI